VTNSATVICNGVSQLSNLHSVILERSPFLIFCQASVMTCVFLASLLPYRRVLVSDSNYVTISFLHAAQFSVHSVLLVDAIQPKSDEPGTE
jgi:hypothetical protein